MKENNNGGETTNQLERYPFPAIRVNTALQTVHRNRLAEKLLPSLRTLRRFLNQIKKSGTEETFLLRELEGVRYYILIFPQKDGYLAAFLESLLPLSESLIKKFLENGVSLMEEVASDGLKSGLLLLPDQEASISRLASRTVRFREEMRRTLNFLSVSQTEADKSCACNVTEWLNLLQARLSDHRIKFSFRGEKEVTARISHEDFLKVMLNLIQFAAVYEGENSSQAEIFSEEGKDVLCFSFCKNAGVFSALLHLTDGENVLENETAASGLFPLFSAMAICRKYEVEVELKEREEKGFFRLYLPPCASAPEMFLGSVEKKTEKVIDDWIGKMFL